MTEDQNSPVFADRYRFEPVSDDWDRGRSGYTHLVYDLKEKRFGVIKRVESISKKQVNGLRNEEKALRTLKGLGVPEVYDSGRTFYDNEEYDYIVVEYIIGTRVEKELSSLSVRQRVEIVTKLFEVLAAAHQHGIVNGDVDLKHLFWRKDSQLVVIDWGNAKINADTRKKTEFAYDLARAAEIIYALVTRKGIPPAVGSIALPGSGDLIPELTSLPLEFNELCKWAPRTPSAGTHAPYSARELLDVSKKWLDAVRKNKEYRNKGTASGRIGFSAFFLTLVAVFCYLLIFIVVPGLQTTVTPTPSQESSQDIPSEISDTSTPSLEVIIETPKPTDTPTEQTTSTPGIIPLSAYSPIIVFDKSLSQNTSQCWINAGPGTLFLNEGLYRRTDLNWGFQVAYDRSVDEIVQVDFDGCATNRNIQAIAVNVVVNRLEIPEYLPSREFGIFVENAGGLRREYTLWLDKATTMYLRIREDGSEKLNTPILVVSADNLKFGGEFPRKYSRFPIQVFLEIDNNGMDVIYLLESSFDALDTNMIDPAAPMIRIDSSILPTIGDAQNIGLVGRGGKTETLIWPLILFERE